LKPEFEQLLERLKELEKDRFETRAFMYLDIISWLESKISDIPVQTVIRNKFLEAQKKQWRELQFNASGIDPLHRILAILHHHFPF